MPLVEDTQANDDSEDFIERSNSIFPERRLRVYSDGKVIRLRGSTPITAYAIHSEVGEVHRAKINGRMVPIKTELQNGDGSR